MIRLVALWALKLALMMAFVAYVLIAGGPMLELIAGGK